MKKHPEMREQTKGRIIEAFWELATEKGITKVNVSEIAKCAGINRGTFYEYFLDVNDLLEFVETEIIEDYKPKVMNIQKEYMQTDFYRMIYKTLELIKGYGNKFFILIGTKGDPVFLLRIKKEMSEHYGQIVCATEMKQYEEYMIALFSSAMIGLLTYWYETGEKISTQELADVVFRFISKEIVQSI